MAQTFICANSLAPVLCRARGIVDSTLSAVGGMDCGGGSRGCDIIGRRMVGDVAAAAGGRAKKKDTVAIGGRGGNDDNNVDDVHASDTGDDGSTIYSRQSLRGG